MIWQYDSRFLPEQGQPVSFILSHWTRFRATSHKYLWTVLSQSKVDFSAFPTLNMYHLIHYFKFFSKIEVFRFFFNAASFRINIASWSLLENQLCLEIRKLGSIKFLLKKCEQARFLVNANLSFCSFGIRTFLRHSGKLKLRLNYEIWRLLKPENRISSKISSSRDLKL